MAATAASDVIELGPESVVHDSANNEEGAANADGHPVVLTGLVVDLTGVITYTGETKVGASLSLAVEGKHVGALADGEGGGETFS
ncbi:cytochrome c oxidase subunit I [Angomonas deanei]|nr:cytochrome c oxidase subunit I [Angomonas deanei]|eukprot:EPY39791.1 cytochrome c oxidase subunit I [Angomonas deanei]